MRILCVCLVAGMFAGSSSLALAEANLHGNVSIGSSWGSAWNSSWHDPWRWRVGISNGWYSYPYRGRYYRPGWGYYGSRWGYYGNRYAYPYRYERRAYKPPEPRVVTPPQRITTSVQYASGLNSLPANARVIQRDGRTLYEWQGIEYVYDWSTQTYQALTGVKH